MKLLPLFAILIIASLVFIYPYAEKAIVSEGTYTNQTYKWYVKQGVVSTDSSGSFLTISSKPGIEDYLLNYNLRNLKVSK